MPEAVLPHKCRCGVRWSGFRVSHCSACHNTFSTDPLFVRHRTISYKCKNPLRLRPALVLNSKGHWDEAT